MNIFGARYGRELTNPRHRCCEWIKLSSASAYRWTAICSSWASITAGISSNESNKKKKLPFLSIFSKFLSRNSCIVRSWSARSCSSTQSRILPASTSSGSTSRCLRFKYIGTTASLFLEEMHICAICRNKCRRETVFPDPGSPMTRKERDFDLMMAWIRLFWTFKVGDIPMEFLTIWQRECIKTIGFFEKCISKSREGSTSTSASSSVYWKSFQSASRLSLCTS